MNDENALFYEDYSIFRIFKSIKIAVFIYHRQRFARKRLIL